MSDRTAASIGLVFAGIALAAAFLPWTDAAVSVLAGAGDLRSPVAAGLAAVALLAFAGRRYGLLDRRVGALVGGGASVALVGYAASRALVSVEMATAVGTGLALALVAGLAGLAAAYLDARAVPGPKVGSLAYHALVATLVGFTGLVVGNLLGALPLVVLADASSAVQYLLLTPLFGLGLGLTALVFVRVTQRSRSYIDLAWPTGTDLAYMAGGSVAILGLWLLLGLLAQLAGVPSAQSGIVEQALGGNPDVLLVLIPLSFLVIGPGEELLFRNIVQKYLYDSFTREGAVVVGCAIFTLMHVFAYWDPNPVALFSTLVRLFFLSLVLGVAYARTDNLTVPAVIHGAFNAVQFALLYVLLKFAPSQLSISAFLALF